MEVISELPKGTFPLICLALTTFFVHRSQRQFTHENPKRKYFRPIVLVLCLALFSLLSFLANKYNFPEYLATTHSEVMQAKMDQIEQCRLAMERGDPLAAEEVILNSALSKQLASIARTRGRPSIAKYFQYAFEPVAFGAMGAMMAVMPLIIILFSLYSTHYRWHLQSHLEAIMPIVLPLTVAGGVMTYCIFFLFIQPGQAHGCLRTSGHWFTYWVTSFWMTVTLVHLSYTQPRLAMMYAVLLAVYQAGALQTLKTTQTYFHSSDEALAGIRAAAWTLPIESVVMILLTRLVRQTVLDRESVIVLSGPNDDRVEGSEASEGEGDVSFDEKDSQAKVLKSYTRSNDPAANELSLVAGQTVTVLRIENDRALVEASGNVPRSYMLELPLLDEKVAARQATAKHNFSAEAEGEMSVAAGDLVNILEDVDDDWLYVSVRGWAPTNRLDL